MALAVVDLLLLQALARAHVHEAARALDAALALGGRAVAAAAGRGDGLRGLDGGVDADVAEAGGRAGRVARVDRGRAAGAAAHVGGEGVRLVLALRGRGGDGGAARGRLRGADDGRLAGVVGEEVVLVPYGAVVGRAVVGGAIAVGGERGAAAARGVGGVGGVRGVRGVRAGAGGRRVAQGQVLEVVLRRLRDGGELVDE